MFDLSKNINYYFNELTKIPHGSFHEEKIADYLEQFAKDHSLRYVRQDCNNVVMYKEASAGYESHPAVMLQAHIDMVCEKNNDVVHDFLKDPLKIYEDEEGWLHASGTTLGADDGTGVSYILSILADDSLAHPALECVFTVQEEVGLVGANELLPEFFTAKKLINLDGGGESSTSVSSSGGRMVYVYRKMMVVENKMPCYRLSVTGLLGGHSGGLIDKERGNANKLAFRVMNAMLRQNMTVSLIHVQGGLKSNAIPRECVIEFATEGQGVEELVEKYNKEIASELEFSDKDVSITVEKIATVSKAYCPNCSKSVIKMMYLLPNGLLAKSLVMNNLPVVSLNLGVAEMKEDIFTASYTCRSPMLSARDEMEESIASVAELFGATVKSENDFNGWNYVAVSPMRELLRETLKEHDLELKEHASHGGLETGVFAGMIEGMDIITFGPIASGAHTPDEKLNLASYERCYGILCEMLAKC